MKIHFDNLIFSMQTAGGVSVYWYELLKRLLKSENSLRILEQAKNRKNIFRNNLSIDNHIITEDSKLPIRFLRHSSPHWKIKGPAIFHSSYYRIIQQKDILNIVTVHDFVHEYYRSGIARLAHSYQKKKAVENAHGIICISNNTRADLFKFFPSIDPNTVKVIYHGVSEAFYPLEESARNFTKKNREEVISDKYILFIGDRSGYKNFQVVLEALADLPGYKLILVGGGALMNNEKKKLKILLQQRYLHLLSIDNTTLNILYNFAHCLIYPSKYEGFGIPLLEAMRAGCPVIAMNQSSIAEVASNAALLIDNTSKEILIKSINYLEYDNNRAALIKKGLLHSSHFSWDKCYNETIKFYEYTYQNHFDRR